MTGALIESPVFRWVVEDLVAEARKDWCAKSCGV